MTAFVLVLLLLAAGAAAYVYAARRRREDAEYRLRAGDREAELRALGISGVRPVATPVAASLPGRTEAVAVPVARTPERNVPEGKRNVAEGKRSAAPEGDLGEEPFEDDPLGEPNEFLAEPFASADERTPAAPRARARRPASEDRADEETSEEERGDEEDPAPPGVADADGVSTARPVVGRRPRGGAPSEPYVADRSPLWPGGEAAGATRLLEALWAELGVQSVALVRHDDAADVLTIDAFLSRREGRRTAPFPAEGNALLRVPADGHVYVIESAAIPSLRYHLDPHEAVGEAVALVVPGPGSALLLVADAAPGERPFTAEQEAVLSTYAGHLAALLAAPDEEAAPIPEAPDGEGPPVPARTVPESGGEPAPAVPLRRRVEIVADEMAAAREAGHPLALALVAPHGAEAVADEGPEAIARVEADLRARLEGVAGTARVERFGELLLGAFCAAGPAEAEAWAAAVEAAGGPVHIGVAVLAERHAEAEEFRADAAAALHEAYARDETCVIVE